MSAYEASSRPVSYISHAGNADSEDGDPWAIHEDVPAQSGYSIHHSHPIEASPPEGSSSHSSDGSGKRTSSPQHDTDSLGELPGASSRYGNGHRGTSGLTSADRTPKAGERTAVSGHRIAAGPSSSSSSDPWQPASPRSAQTPPSNLPKRFSNIPTSSSAIRGGFSFSQGPEVARPSSPYDVAKSDVLAQKSTLAHLKNQPGPWDDEQVYVTLRPELEGLIFKYNSYNIVRKRAQPDHSTVKLTGPSAGSTLAHTRAAQAKGRSGADSSSRPSSTDEDYVLAQSKTVVRRYSDFVWMNEILIKRYPFRIVPILPPKRLSIPVAGRHFSSDDGFMERRRRGLQRYLRALAAHSILGRDELVQVFLTEKQPLTEWKHSNSPPATEEEAFTSPPQPSSLLSIPSDLSSKVEQTSNHTNSMVEKWTNFVNLFERICKRLEAQGLDYSRLASQLDSLTSVNQSCFKPESDPEDHSTSLRETSNHVASLNRDFSDLLTVRGKHSSQSTLEELKSQRDLWMAFRDLLARHTALSTDNVPALKQRIAASRTKISTLQSTPIESRSQSYHSDIDKVEASIQADSLQVESLLKRREFIRLYMWQELNWLWKCKTQPIENTWKQWCRDELVGKSAERKAVEECWKDLGGQ
ncbi:unnamed protein product [Sympodiomycopsis kandeliae]